MQLNNTPLVVEKNNYGIEIINVYIVYDLGNWPKISLNNFALKSCLFGATNIVKNSDNCKYVYSGYGLRFDVLGLWTFANVFARNVEML